MKVRPELANALRHLAGHCQLGHRGMCQLGDTLCENLMSNLSRWSIGVFDIVVFESPVPTFGHGGIRRQGAVAGEQGDAA